MQQDTTVSLLDEIHLKPYIDYKGGNTVGLSDNSNEAATSAFTFMLSSVFSQYKDVVHVMSTKCLKAENLFDIVKHTIIGLEEIDFQVLSIITNTKAISFFCSPPKAFHCISTPSYKISTTLLPLQLSPYIKIHLKQLEWSKRCK